MVQDVRDALGATLMACSAEEALAYRGEWYDWAFMRKVHAALDTALSAAGLNAGTPVALVSRNRPPHVAAVVSLLAAGRTTCMIYGAQTPVGLAGEVRRLKAPVVAADADDWSDALRAAVEETGAIGVILRSDRQAPVELAPAVLGRPRSDFKAADPDVALELLSSGTTGPPKRIPLKWFTVSAAVEDGRAVYAASGSDTDAPAIMIHPLGNVSGLSYAVTPLAFRRRVALLEKFELDAWLEAVKRYRPRRGALPPAAIRMVLDAKAPVEDLASLTVIGTGGSALNPEVQTAFEAHYGIPVVVALGATEFGGVVANWTVDLHRRFAAQKRGSVGKVRPGVTLRVVDPTTFEPAPTNATGLLEALVDRIGPDWIRTTDLASIDDDGFVYLHGRADLAINRGGFKIVPETISAALSAHPAAGEVVVVGLPDERLGQVPAVAMEIKPGEDIPSEAELLAFARDRLLAYQVPVRILAMRHLPRNVSMKASMSDISEMLASSLRTA